MAVTKEKLEQLEDALFEGVTTVKYADREVTYRSLNEMERIRNMMKKELEGSNGSIVAAPTYDRGYQ